jgi:hypothetical protein
MELFDMLERMNKGRIVLLNKFIVFLCLFATYDSKNFIDANLCVFFKGWIIIGVFNDFKRKNLIQENQPFKR